MFAIKPSTAINKIDDYFTKFDIVFIGPDPIELPRGAQFTLRLVALDQQKMSNIEQYEIRACDCQQSSDQTEMDCRLSLRGLMWNLKTVNFYTFILSGFILGIICLAAWIRLKFKRASYGDWINDELASDRNKTVLFLAM